MRHYLCVYAAATLVVFLACGPLGAQEEANKPEVRPELLKLKTFMAVAVSISGPDQVLKQTGLNDDGLKAAVERFLKGKKFRIVEVGDKRNNIAMAVLVRISADGTIEHEINVIVVQRDPENGEQKAHIAFHEVTSQKARTPRQVQALLNRGVQGDLQKFIGVYNKINAK